MTEPGRFEGRGTEREKLSGRVKRRGRTATRVPTRARVASAPLVCNFEYLASRGKNTCALDPGSLDCQPETNRVHGRLERREQGHRPTLGIKQENLHHRMFAVEFREGNTLDLNIEDERRWSKQT